jgi:predicted  nucleic acid-binding Zn-ribbon protein
VSIREQIPTLEELAAIDVDVRRIDEQLTGQRAELDAMQTEVRAIEARLATDRERLGEIEKTRNELSIELRQMIQQIERSRERHGRSRNEREKNAAERELDELRKLHRDREDEVEKLSMLAEAARKSIDEADRRRRELLATLEGVSSGAAATLSELEQQKATRTERRKGLVAKLPAVLYRRYESIRTRRAMAIAKTTDGTCLGCHISVPPMMFQKMLRQEEFEQCPNCRRILYYMPASQGGDASASEPGSSDARAG